MRQKTWIGHFSRWNNPWTTTIVEGEFSERNGLKCRSWNLKEQLSHRGKRHKLFNRSQNWKQNKNVSDNNGYVCYRKYTFDNTSQVFGYNKFSSGKKKNNRFSLSHCGMSRFHIWRRNEEFPFLTSTVQKFASFEFINIFDRFTVPYPTRFD